MYTHCIWDFNGTILDDVEAGIRSVNQLLRERGLRELANQEEYRRVFGFPIRSYYERIGFDFSVEPYEVLAPKWVALYLENVKASDVRQGVRELMTWFRQKGISQTLLSATEQNMLSKQIHALGFFGEFDEIFGLDNIHAYSKVQQARLWRENHPQARAFLIGDTEHDYEAACAMGADCYLIVGGHQSKETLLKTGAVVLDSFEELEAYLKKNSKIS